MDRAGFEAELSRDGYEIVTVTMQPHKLNGDHQHTFDARLLVIEGEMTVAREGDRQTYRPGQTFSMSAGCLHSELAGPEGATYVAGRRYKPD
jgi:quercetin dioxygenase-like cupin family protein